MRRNKVIKMPLSDECENYTLALSVMDINTSAKLIRAGTKLTPRIIKKLKKRNIKYVYVYDKNIK